METKQFLKSVLGSEGYYCIFAAKQKGIIKQKLCDSLDTAIEIASEFDRDGWDTYFSLATFQTDKSREASNALYLRSFFLDIDCGDEKPFPTQADGYKALRSFCKLTQLPKPTVVSSGRGLHVYWMLTEQIPKEDWERVAFAFKKKCLDSGLRIDPSVPADAARVLRVPGTHHYKENPPKPVKVIGDLEPPIEFTQFKDLFGEMERPKANKAFNQRSEMMNTLMGNFTSKFKNILIKTLDGKGCPQIYHIASNQPEVSEPLWRAGLSIASECSDASVAIHRISNKHPNYSREETEEKAALTKGPYLCTTFDAIREGVCPKCQHWGKIKSPIQLGKELETVEGETEVVVPQESIDGNVLAERKYTIPEYPEPYTKGKNGGIYKKQKKLFCFHSRRSSGEWSDLKGMGYLPKLSPFSYQSSHSPTISARSTAGFSSTTGAGFLAAFLTSGSTSGSLASAFGAGAASLGAGITPSVCETLSVTALIVSG